MKWANLATCKTWYGCEQGLQVVWESGQIVTQALYMASPIESFFLELQKIPMFKLMTLKHGDETSYGPTIFATYATICWTTKRKHHTMKGRNMSQVRKLEWSTIGLDITDSSWAMFIDAWTCYKGMCELTDPAFTQNNLRTACPPEVKRLLFKLVGAMTLNSATEEQLLQQIQPVRGLHKEVDGFYSMRQKEWQSITHFLAWLWAWAKFCEFIVTCGNTTNCSWQVNYSNNMLQDK